MSTATVSKFRGRPRTLRRTTTQRGTKQLQQIGTPSRAGLNKKGHLPSLEGTKKRAAVAGSPFPIFNNQLLRSNYVYCSIHLLYLGLTLETVC